MHAFDYKEISDKTIVVRRARKGETIIPLNEKEYGLDENILVIADKSRPVGLAGVMGGLNSGIKPDTSTVLLEAAEFNRENIRRTSRRLGIRSDSSARFEKGVDSYTAHLGLMRALHLISKLKCGRIAADTIESLSHEIKEREIKFHYSRVKNLLGIDIPQSESKKILENLGIKTEFEGQTLKCFAPAYRRDLESDCDIIEEIIRVYGYNKIVSSYLENTVPTYGGIYGYNNVEIPSTLKSSLTTKGDCDKSNKLQNLVAEQLVGCGFNEILNNSLTRAAYYDGLESYPSKNLVMLLNPLSADLNCMRQTLLFGGLESIAHNANRKNADLKFFEFGNCYHFDAEKKNPEKVLAPYSEDYHLGLWVTGKMVSNSWAHADENTSVYELKAYVENIFKRLGLDLHSLVVGNLSDDIYSTALTVNTKGGKRLATFGVVTKKMLKAFDVDNEVYYADLNWKELMKAIRSVKVSYKEISKFPAVKRDLALLLDKKVQFAEIEKIAYETEKKLLKEVSLFDVYEGKNLEAGKKSYAVSFLLQDESQTLNDKMIDKIMSKLVKNLEDKLGAKLR